MLAKPVEIRSRTQQCRVTPGGGCGLYKIAPGFFLSLALDGSNITSLKRGSTVEQRLSDKYDVCSRKHQK